MKVYITVHKIYASFMKCALGMAKATQLSNVLEINQDMIIYRI